MLDLVLGVTISLAIFRWRGEPTESGQLQLTGCAGCSAFVLIGLYWIAPEWIFSATLGKAIFRLQVVPIRGTEIGFVQSIKRNIPKAIDSAFLYAFDFVIALSSPLRQSAGDRWAGTIVVDRKAYAAWRAKGSPPDFDRKRSEQRRSGPEVSR